jgi:hypothetical protein
VRCEFFADGVAHEITNFLRGHEDECVHACSLSIQTSIVKLYPAG